VSYFLPGDRLFAMPDELFGEVGTIRSLDAPPYLERFAVSDKRLLRMESLQAHRSDLRTAPLFSSGNWMIPTLTTVFPRTARVACR
jgi:hypothetical protein